MSTPGHEVKESGQESGVVKNEPGEGVKEGESETVKGGLGEAQEASDKAQSDPVQGEKTGEVQEAPNDGENKDMTVEEGDGDGSQIDYGEEEEGEDDRG